MLVQKANTTHRAERYNRIIYVERRKKRLLKFISYGFNGGNGNNTRNEYYDQATRNFLQQGHYHRKKSSFCFHYHGEERLSFFRVSVELFSVPWRVLGFRAKPTTTEHDKRPTFDFDSHRKRQAVVLVECFFSSSEIFIDDDLNSSRYVRYIFCTQKIGMFFKN